jgi:hypothetical protein
MKRFAISLLVILLSGCIVSPTPEPTVTVTLPFVIASPDNPYAPTSEDSGLRPMGVVFISIDLVERTDLSPVRVELNLLGSLPSTCNELRIEVSRPNDQYQIFVEVYGLQNPRLKCDNVFQQFNAGVLLGVYSPGRYTVWVNQGLIADFVAE